MVWAMLLRLLAGLAAIWFGLGAAWAAGGSWKFSTANQDQPELSYAENGKTLFWVGCGSSFGLHAVYPGAPKKNEEPAAITIANGKTQMRLDGLIEYRFSRVDADKMHFAQWNLGYKRSDPGLFEKEWREKEHRLLDFLDSGQPLTVSAEGKSYVLPAINAPGWKQRFEKIC
jgi:hypothetical protein